MRTDELTIPIRGTKVHYKDPYTNKIENGIIQTFVPPEGMNFNDETYSKRLVSLIKEVFVVYESTCGGNWAKFDCYTAQRTSLENLHKGWKKILNWNKDKLIEQSKNYYKYGV